VLKINGKDKTFTAEPTGRAVYDAAEASVQLESQPFDNELLDTLSDFVVKLFGKQFTRDELIDGLGVGTYGKTLLGYVQLGDENGVLNRFFRKGEQLPN
jgi:hypothetical protein